MTAPQGPSTLTTSAIVDGQGIDAADVLVPLNEAAADIDEARTTLAISDDDTTVGYLADKLLAGTGISLTVGAPAGDETLTIANTSAAVPVGTLLPYLGATAPTGFLMTYGQLVSATTYLDLLNTLLTNTVFTLTLDTGVVFTADNATNLYTSAGHGLSEDDVVLVSNSGGGLPAGLTASTPYYVVNTTLNDFQLSETEGGAAVDITTNGTGTQSFHETWAVPDLRGRSPIGVDNQGGSSANRVTASAADSVGGSGGAETVTLAAANIPPLPVTIKTGAATAGSAIQGSNASDTEYTLASKVNAGVTPSAVAIMNPWLAVNWIIRY